MKQKAAVIFESEETVVFKRSGKRVTGFCPRCASDVEMIAPDVLSIITASSEREIFRLLEAGHVYFVEEDRVLVCASCYAEFIREGASDGQPEGQDLLIEKKKEL